VLEFGDLVAIGVDNLHRFIDHWARVRRAKSAMQEPTKGEEALDEHAGICGGPQDRVLPPETLSEWEHEFGRDILRYRDDCACYGDEAESRANVEKRHRHGRGRQTMARRRLLRCPVLKG
jgi:hypothetical protein